MGLSNAHTETRDVMRNASNVGEGGEGVISNSTILLSLSCTGDRGMGMGDDGGSDESLSSSRESPSLTGDDSGEDSGDEIGEDGGKTSSASFSCTTGARADDERERVRGRTGVDGQRGGACESAGTRSATPSATSRRSRGFSGVVGAGSAASAAGAFFALVFRATGLGLGTKGRTKGRSRSDDVVKDTRREGEEAPKMPSMSRANP